MTSAVPQRFLAEWYVPECAEADVSDIVQLMRAATSGRGRCSAVRLVATLAVPADEVVFGLFDAPSADSVTDACERAGLPPMRINAALDGGLSGSRVPG